MYLCSEQDDCGCWEKMIRWTMKKIVAVVFRNTILSTEDTTQLSPGLEEYVNYKKVLEIECWIVEMDTLYIHVFSCRIIYK